MVPSGLIGPGFSGRRPTSLEEVLERSQALGFLGPGPIGDHLRHTEVFRDALTGLHPATRPGTAVELGSGGGVPGLVLAASPELAGWRWKLLEAMERRTSFLRWGVCELGLGDRVTVLEARAEAAARDPVHRHLADVVISRSFGRPAVTAECAAGLLRAGGTLLVSEPPGTAIDPGRWPAAGLAVLGLKVVRLIRHGRSGVLMLRQSTASDDRYPRRTGIPSKRPLF